MVTNLLMRLLLIKNLIRYLWLLKFRLYIILVKSLRWTNYAFNHGNCFIMNFIFFSFLILLKCIQLHCLKLIFDFMKFLNILSSIIFTLMYVIINICRIIRLVNWLSNYFILFKLSWFCWNKIFKILIFA
jgi:hypothetical protein